MAQPPTFPGEAPTATAPPGDRQPRMLIVCGHPRSGTTMLTQLLDSHPDIGMTYEFHNFLGVGKPWRQHLRLLRKRDRWRLPPIRLRGGHRRWPSRFAGVLFQLCYAFGIAQLSRDPIDLDGMRRVLHRLFPRARVIGDKYPRYVFSLDRFSLVPELLIVVIYRDARDVVRSAIEQSKKDWRHTPLGARMATPAGAAQSWVRAIHAMDSHRQFVHTIRYEDLVSQPGLVVLDLAVYLGVDPGGFRYRFIKPDRVGKHKQGLTEADLAVVEEVAGVTMRRLGYT